jgi:flavodoxin
MITGEVDSAATEVIAEVIAEVTADEELEVVVFDDKLSAKAAVEFVINIAANANPAMYFLMKKLSLR